MVWPGYAIGGADGGVRHPWGESIRLWIRAGLAAGRGWRIGVNAADRLDAGNVMGPVATTAEPPTIDGRLWVDLSCDAITTEIVDGSTSAVGIFSRDEAATLDIELYDPERKYDPLNTASPYWYQGRTRLVAGSSIEVFAEVLGAATVPAVPTGLVLGGTGEYATTPDSAGLSITGDIDIRVKLSLPDWTPAPAAFGVPILSKWTVAGNQGSYRLSLYTTGQLLLEWTPTGGPTWIGAPSTVLGFVDGSTHWVRAVLDVDNGAGGWTAAFYVSDDGVFWTAAGGSTQPGVTSIFNSTAPVQLGRWYSDAGAVTMAGTIYAAQIYAGAHGESLRGNPNFDADGVPIAASGAGTYTDSIGNVWTKQGGATVTAIAAYTPAFTRFTLFTGTVDRWEHDIQRDPLDRRTRVIASGAVKAMSHTNYPESGALGAGDTTAERIARLRAYYGWQPAIVQVGASTPGVTLQATTFAQSFWELLNRTLDDELGYVHILPDGRIRWLSRAVWASVPAPVLTLGCALGQLDIATLVTMGALDGQLRNAVYATRVGGTQQVVKSAPSIADHGGFESALTRTDLGLQTDVQVAEWASTVVMLYAYPTPGPATIELVPAREGEATGAIWRAVLGVNFASDVVRVLWNPTDDTAPLDASVRVVGVKHSITPERWTVTWQTVPATFNPFNIWHIGVHALDRLDRGNVLGYAHAV